jgi:hypothetical protein
MQTKIIGGGTVVPGVELGVDPTFQAGRFSIRPLDYAIAGQVLGHFEVAGTTTAAAPTANSILFSLRWADPSRFFVLQRLSAFISVVTAVTAQRVDPMVATIQRAYTASETTNAGSILPTANSNKRRVSMGSTLVTQMAVATAAAGISGGTKTADAFPFASLPVPSIVAIGSGTPQDDFIRADQLNFHPLTLSNNEGITVAWGGTTLATGTVEVSFVIGWAEVVTL